jgi:hypothetical protein
MDSRGAETDWPRGAFHGGAPVVVSTRREGAFLSALSCADCAPKVRQGEPSVTARVPER